MGADVHLVPGLGEGLDSGRIPTINRSRYFLLEPSHTTPPPRFEDSVFSLIVAGYVPVITHPERLTWIEGHFPVFQRLVAQGAWTQITAGALLGVFGKKAKYWSDKFVCEGMTHILASDAHSTGRRLPQLSPARRTVEQLIGSTEAMLMVEGRPSVILQNQEPKVGALTSRLPKRKDGLLQVLARMAGFNP